MKTAIRIILIMLVGAFCLDADLWAQDLSGRQTAVLADDPAQPAWQRSIQEIKRRTQALLEENRQLRSEHDTLQADVSSLERELKRAARLREEVPSSQPLERAAVSLPEAGVAAHPDDLSAIRRDVAALEGKIKDYKEQLSQADPLLKLWRLKVESLQAQKRGLTFSLEERKSWPEESLEEQEPQKSVEDRKQGGDAPGSSRDETEVINSLSQRWSIQKEKNAKLSSEYNKLLKDFEKALAEKKKEKALLESQITLLDAKVNETKGAVEGYSALQDQKRALINDIMQVDELNQSLRKQISDIKEELGKMEKEK